MTRNNNHIATDFSTSAGTFIYYFAFAIYLLTYYLNKTSFVDILSINTETIYDAGRFVCVFLLAMKCLLQRYSFKQAIALLAVGALVVTSWYVSRDWNLILLFMFIAAGQGVSIKNLAAIALITEIAIICITVAFAAAGAIEIRYIYRIVDSSLEVRSSYGFSHPNQFGQVLLAISCSFAVLRFPKFQLLDIIIYITAAVICSNVADSRTSVLCIALIAVFAFAVQFVNRKDLQKKVLIVEVFVVCFCIAISYYMMVFYDPGTQWMRGINSMTASRFSLAHMYYSAYPPTIIGRKAGTLVMSLGTFVQYGPDNAYVRMLLQDGFLPTIIFFAAYILTLVSYCRCSKFDACTFGLVIYAIVAVAESNSLHFAANYYLIGTSMLLYGFIKPIVGQPNRSVDRRSQPVDSTINIGHKYENGDDSETCSLI